MLLWMIYLAFFDKCIFQPLLSLWAETRRVSCLKSLPSTLNKNGTIWLILPKTTCLLSPPTLPAGDGSAGINSQSASPHKPPGE